MLREKSLDRRTIASVLQISKNTVDIHLDHSQKKVREYVEQKMNIGSDKTNLELAA
jgi:FixJ family two-component response regulator